MAASSSTHTPSTTSSFKSPESGSTSAFPSSHNATTAASNTTPPTIVHYNSKVVRCRIDRGVPIDEIIKQLCASPQLAVNDPASLFALRDVADNELLTAENMNRKLDGRASFNLVPSPVIEAADSVDRLVGSDKQAIKSATFALKTYVREEPFLVEFVKRGGVSALAGVIQDSTGNTLAYALNAMQSILDLDYGYKDLDVTFVRKITSTITSQALVNIVRPALAILRRLIATDHPSFGFRQVWPCLVQEESFFTALAKRITREGDKLLTSGALSLLNAITKNIPRDRLLETVEKLENYKFRKAVISLIETRAEDLTPQILQFQQNYATAWYELQLQPVNLEDVKHAAILQSVYEHSGLDTAQYTTDNYDYRKLGFAQNPPDITYDFLNAGVLGMYTLHHIATAHRETFESMVLEQVNRPDDKRCPVALVSLQVTRILSEQFDFSGSLASTSFQPFLLDLYRIHLMVMEFFIRMYSESGATIGDFARVSTLTVSQVRLSLGRGPLDYQPSQQEINPKTFFALKQEFEQARYEEVRDRQMKELEIEDDLMSKLPVRSLRDKLYHESFEFVRAQRISCLQQGSWFAVAQAPTGGASSANRLRSAAKYRFYRLAPNRRFLHFVEASERLPIRGGLDDLPEKIDITTLSDVIGGTGERSSLAQVRSHSDGASFQPSSSANSGKGQSQLQQTAQGSPYSITLMSQDTLAAEMVAPDQTVYTEWLDGLNLLLPGGFIATKETADIVQTLTDIGVKIRLLDLTGERLEIPTVIPTPIVPPSTVPFYYAE